MTAAIARARAAQPAWAATSFAERRRVLRCLLQYIVDHQEDICRVAARDSGKSSACEFLRLATAGVRRAR